MCFFFSIAIYNYLIFLIFTSETTLREANSWSDQATIKDASARRSIFLYPYLVYMLHPRKCYKSSSFKCSFLLSFSFVFILHKCCSIKLISLEYCLLSIKLDLRWSWVVRLCRCPNPTGLSCWVELSSARVDVPIQPAVVVFVVFLFSFLLLPGYGFPET